MSVPDEAVEAAAEKLGELNSDAGDQLTDKDWARELLEAAAPFIAAQAWDEGAKSTQDFMQEFWAADELPLPPNNPYRSGT